MESLVLYRKYRPRTFGEIIGQEHVVRTLRNALAQGKIAHAYLFAGPRGSGKTTIARLLAKAANCLELTVDSGQGTSQTEPCNRCANCQDFNSGRSLDLIEIDAASNRGIDEIKNLRENVRFGPSTGKYKVYLIDEAHMLTKEAFNAFLKTLEEPPAHAIFILATTEAHRLLPTIVSRTQRFDFKRLSLKEIVGRLEFLCRQEKISAESEALKFIAHEADGSARDAESLLGQILATGEDKITLAQTEEILGLFSHRKIQDFVSLAVAGDKAACLNWLQQSADSGHDINQFIKALNHYIRKMMMVGLSPDLARFVKADVAEEDFKVLEDQAKKTRPIELARWLKVFSEARQNLENYPLPQMAVEIAIINLISEKTNSDNCSNLANTETFKNPKSEIRNPKQIADPDSQTSNEANKLDNPVPTLSAVTCSLPADKSMLELVQTRWSDIVAAVQPYNHSLFGFLQGMKVKDATAASLVLATKYSFHKERLSETKNKKIIEDAVEKVVGKRLSLNCVLEK